MDFGRGPVIDDPELGRVTTWIFVMTLAWSRHTYAEVVLDQTPGFDRGPPSGSPGTRTFPAELSVCSQSISGVLATHLRPPSFQPLRVDQREPPVRLAAELEHAATTRGSRPDADGPSLQVEADLHRLDVIAEHGDGGFGQHELAGLRTVTPEVVESTVAPPSKKVKSLLMSISSEVTA